MRILLSFVVIFCACSTPSGVVNPPAPGFDAAGSDEKAVMIADQVMSAMGGRKAWDETQIISWNFSGRRHLIWNKGTGQVRIDMPSDSTVLLLDLNEKTIRAEVKGEEIVQQDSLAKLYKRGEGIWINDSYWLVMPFKLKDSGVTLSYIGMDTTQNGIDADVLQLRFKNVGNTPDNMYKVWVDRSDQLIKQWAFYAQYDQEKPPAIWPWDNYQNYGQIKLSAERSDSRGPKFVQVFDSVPETIFSDFTQPDIVRF